MNLIPEKRWSLKKSTKVVRIWKSGSNIVLGVFITSRLLITLPIFVVQILISKIL
jgi:hypothetical protein